MANHSFHEKVYGLEPKPVALFAVVNIGATGAPTVSRAKGITSVTRVSAGKYTLTLDSTYQSLLGFDVKVLAASGLPTTPVSAVVSQAVNTTGAIVFQMSAPTSSSVTTLLATDPANGDVLYIQVNLSDSTAF